MLARNVIEPVISAINGRKRNAAKAIADVRGRKFFMWVRM